MHNESPNAGESSMTEAEIDRILCTRDDIQPSSGFTAAVMEAVRREASVPPPIPFPWKRALPILVLAAFALALVAVAGLAAIVQAGRGAVIPHAVSSMPPVSNLIPAGLGSALAWTAASLLGAYVVVKLSMRFAGGTT